VTKGVIDVSVYVTLFALAVVLVFRDGGLILLCIDYKQYSTQNEVPHAESSQETAAKNYNVDNEF